MDPEEHARIDKFLWAVRMFKTRSQATEACRKGSVEVGGIKVKPSRIVHSGEIIHIRKNQVHYQIEVIRPAEKRMGAKEVPEYIVDLTPEEELEKLKIRKAMYSGVKQRFPGRPTKRNRRMLDRFFDNEK